MLYFINHINYIILHYSEVLGGAAGAGALSLSLEEPVRYGSGCPVEKLLDRRRLAWSFCFVLVQGVLISPGQMGSTLLFFRKGYHTMRTKQREASELFLFRIGSEK